MKTGFEFQSCATTPFFRKRYCVPPPTVSPWAFLVPEQPPTLMVFAADRVTCSPATTMPSPLASVSRRSTLNPWSAPFVGSQRVVGQACGPGALESTGAVSDDCRAPSRLMSSIHQPSSPGTLTQLATVSYDSSFWSNSHDSAIQRIRTL